MTPPTATAIDRSALPHPQAPARPRARPAGPAPRRVGAPARARGLAAPLGARVVSGVRGLPDARLLDRLIHGRAWIALVGVMLMGLVFLQVSLLGLNTGIARGQQAAATLERQNGDLRMQVASLGSGERIQDIAARAGMVTPAAGSYHYLNARGVDPQVAARDVTRPAPVRQQTAEELGLLPAAGVSAPAPGVTTPTPATPTAAPAAQAPATAVTPTAAQAPATPQAAAVTPVAVDATPAASTAATPAATATPAAAATPAATATATAGGVAATPTGG